MKELDRLFEITYPDVEAMLGSMTPEKKERVLIKWGEMVQANWLDVCARGHGRRTP